MAINIYIKRLLLAFLILSGLAPLLQAQSAGSFIDTENGEPRFFQRLVWSGGEYALRFEVVVQREVDGTYITHLREFTEKSSIVVSLPTGDYRYQVTSYDILDRLEEVSQWVNFKIHPFVQPEVFVAESELAANDRDSALSTDDVHESEPEGEEITAEPLKPILLFAGLSWSPVLPIHGDSFGADFSPAGAAARFGAAFPVPGDIYVGAELTALWHTNAEDENALSLGVNFLAMKRLSNQTMALNFRAGLSFILLPDIQEKLAFNIGASYLWQFTDKIFLEAGFDYAALLKETYFDGCIRPWIGIGMVF